MEYLIYRGKVNIIGAITKLISFSVATVCGASLAGPLIQEGIGAPPRSNFAAAVLPAVSSRWCIAALLLPSVSSRWHPPASNIFQIALRHSAPASNSSATAPLPATASRLLFAVAPQPATTSPRRPGRSAALPQRRSAASSRWLSAAGPGWSAASPRRPRQQQTSSGGEKYSGLASNLAHLGRIC